MLNLSAQLFAQLGSLRAHVTEHGTAKAYRPTVLAVCEKYSFQRMFSATSLRSPMQATIIRVDDGAFGANGPAFKRVQLTPESRVVKIVPPSPKAQPRPPWLKTARTRRASTSAPPIFMCFQFSPPLLVCIRYV